MMESVLKKNYYYYTLRWSMDYTTVYSSIGTRTHQFRSLLGDTVGLPSTGSKDRSRPSERRTLVLNYGRLKWRLRAKVPLTNTRVRRDNPVTFDPIKNITDSRTTVSRTKYNVQSECIF